MVATGPVVGFVRDDARIPHGNNRRVAKPHATFREVTQQAVHVLLRPRWETVVDCQTCYVVIRELAFWSLYTAFVTRISA